jgi:hypothetical protein
MKHLVTFDNYCIKYFYKFFLFLCIDFSVELRDMDLTSFRTQGGDVYHGGWKDDKKHGKGRLLYSNDAVYEGDFVEGKKHGSGILIFINDDKYEGEWR